MDGIVLADKPAGISSHALVAHARRELGIRRIGHAGTLDPFATGLLILLVGRATRTQRYLMALPKTYEVLAQLGARSSTGDPEGEIERTGVFPPEPLDLPTGAVRQRPPAYSAVKVAGERAYRRARRGERVELPERTVQVEEFSLLHRDGDRAAFRIVCSSGTYVRSLIADLGDAYCLQLRRTAIGPFTVEGAWNGTGAPPVIGLEDALAPVMAVIELDDERARLAAHGRPLADVCGPGPVLLRDERGPVAIADAGEGDPLRPVIGFRG